MARDNFTVDDLKDIVAGALSTVLSRASERGTRSETRSTGSSNNEQPRKGEQVAEEDEEVPPLPAPLQTETRRKYILLI